MNLNGDSRGRFVVGPIALLIGLVLVSAGGCGASNPLAGMKTYPVKGKITLPDGKPLTSGKLILVGMKSGISSVTNVESDGSFNFSSGSNGGGVPDGEYKVRLDIIQGPAGKQKGSAAPFPSKYLDEEGSDLVVTVKPDDTNNLDLKLTPNVAAKAVSGRRGDSR
jgi:hypothetical protein